MISIKKKSFCCEKVVAIIFNHVVGSTFTSSLNFVKILMTGLEISDAVLLVPFRKNKDI